jgi:hypothetical protein
MSKTEFKLEYPIKSASISVLWTSIGTPLGLSEWFADEVSVSDNNYTFVWESYEQDAVLIQSKINKLIRFQWQEDAGTDAFFEIEIARESITGHISLIVTDFAVADEKDDMILLWNKQIETLCRKIGI